MGLFGGGALRRQIEALSIEMESLREEATKATDEANDLRRQLADREDRLREARDAKKKVEKKLSKAANARSSADGQIDEQREEVARLEAELADYRRELLAARRETETVRAQLAKHGVGKVSTAPAETEADSPETPDVPVEQTVETFDSTRVDRRVARLEEKLADEKERRREMKEQVTQAQRGARDADRKRISDLNKAEAVVRDLQHSLRSERRAYKILQLQFEGLRARLVAAGVEIEQHLPDASELDIPATEIAEQAAPIVVPGWSEEEPEPEAIDDTVISDESADASADTTVESDGGDSTEEAAEADEASTESSQDEEADKESEDGGSGDEGEETSTDPEGAGPIRTRVKLRS